MALKIEWSDESRADIRALDRSAALFVFDGLLRYAQTGAGDIKKLQGDFAGRLRLRIGDYRVLLTPLEGTLRVLTVKNLKTRTADFLVSEP